MQTGLECMVCFMRQALTTARLSTDDPELHRLVVTATGRLLSRLDLSLSPPENAVFVYKQIGELTGIADPYKQLKIESNSFAQGLREQVRARIDNSKNSLYTAVRYAIAGNIMDYGAQHEFDAMQVLSKSLDEKLHIDDFELLSSEVTGASSLKILYLADNCGEIVFDALLVEELLGYGHKVTMVVRDKEILNDATIRDAEDMGIGKLCRVIGNGTSCPGTPLKSCSNVLQEAFSRADLIISKGQGNFETLSEAARPVFFLLTVKCEVVARHIEKLKNVPCTGIKGRGEMVLMKMEARNGDATN